MDGHSQLQDTAPHPFRPIDHESIADAVVDQIESLILAGVLKDGAKLPSERELAELLDVSRPKLREALKRLEGFGLIEVRHGDGSFVTQLTGKAMSPALIDLYARHNTAFFDYLEYRREQEGFAARLAAERATKSDKAAIADLIAEQQQALEQDDVEASLDADIAFHVAIVDASHNTTLIHMMESIYDLTKRGLFYNRSFLRTVDGSGQKLQDQHEAIGNAIIGADPDAACAAAYAHMDFVAKSFRIGQETMRREEIASRRRLLAMRGSRPGPA